MNRSRITGNLTSHGILYSDIANDRVGIGSTIPGNKVSLPDSAKIGLGNAEDLEIWHDGTGSQINNDTGYLVIQSDDLRLRDKASGHPYLKGVADGAVELYHDNAKKFETSSTGATVTGALTATSFVGGLPITSGADNRIITASSASAIQGESGLTYNGSILNLTGDLAVSTANRIYFGNSDVAWVKGEHGGSGYLQFGVNTEHMRLLRSGNLGIGTNNPVGNLEVRDSKANLIVAKDGLTVKANSALHTTYDFFQIGAGGAIASYSTETVTASTHFIHNAYRHSGGNWKRRYADTATRIGMNSPGGAIEFEHAVNGNADTDITWVQSLMVNSSGYVGVKRSTPLANLHTTNNELALGANPTSAAAPNATYDGLVVDGEAASIINIRSRGNGSDSYGRVAFSDDTRSRAYVEYRHKDGSGDDTMRFATAGGERLRITSGGKVGVNEASPDHMFHIKGTSADNNPVLAVESSSWASGKSAALRLSYTDGNAREIRGHYDHGLQFFLNNGEAMRIETDHDFRLSGGDAGTNYGWIRGWQSSTGDMIISADHSSTGSGTSKSNLIFKSRGSEKMRITFDGNIQIGAGSVALPKASLGGVDIDSGGYTACIGGNVNSSGRTNSTDKINRITSPHYTNAEEPVALVASYNQTGNNFIQYGGGSSITNAVTVHQFYTAANTTTTAGTERFRIHSSGNVSIGGIVPVPTDSAYNTASLHIHQQTNSSSAGAQIHLTTANSGSAAGDGSQLSQYNNWLYINNQDSGGIQFFANGSERGRFNSTGEFTVGTATGYGGLSVSKRGADSVNKPFIEAGMGATGGDFCFATRYSGGNSDYFANIISTNYSSGRSTYGHGVRGARQNEGGTYLNDNIAFASTFDNFGMCAKAITMDGNYTSIWGELSASTTSVGSEVPMKEFFRVDNAGQVWINPRQDTTNGYLHVQGTDGGTAGIMAGGGTNGQTTGYMEVNQDGQHGGGMMYNGDGSPAFATGESADHFSLYRNHTGTRHVVAQWSYDSNNSLFKGDMDIDNGTSTLVRVTGDSAGTAGVSVGGDSSGQSQCTGFVEVHQDRSHGGGFAYNGDGSPGFVSGETADHVTFYRIAAGARHRVFHYSYSDANVNFAGTITNCEGIYLNYNKWSYQRGLFTTGQSAQNNNNAPLLANNNNHYAYGYQEGYRTSSGGWSSPYPSLVMGYHTGMEFGGHPNYEGCRFYPDHPSANRNIIMSVGNGSSGVHVTNTFTAGTKTFRIAHPHPSKKYTHDLVHSVIEGPQCDNIYRGKVTLSSGTATINIDTVSNMTDGTFVLLNRDIQCFTSNETGWDAVKGSVSGNILTITAQDNSSTDTISWMVVGERQDDKIKSPDVEVTDSNGKLIMEPLTIEETHL